MQISRYPLHHLKPEYLPLLSTSEQQYLHAHHSLLAAHYHSSFLSQFPTPLQRLDDTAGGISMVDGPDVDNAVFCRVRARDIGEVAIQGTGAAFEMKRGDVFVVRWSVIKDLVGEGKVELI
jgi:GINS complex subunit 4